MYNSAMFILQEHAREILSRFIPFNMLLRCFSIIPLSKYFLIQGMA